MGKKYAETKKNPDFFKKNTIFFKKALYFSQNWGYVINVTRGTTPKN